MSLTVTNPSYDRVYPMRAWRDNNVRLTFTQGEGATVLDGTVTRIKAPRFQLRDDQGAIGLSGSPVISLALTRPDKSEDLLACTVIDAANGIISCPITASATAIAGEATGEIRVSATNGTIKFYGIHAIIYKGVSDAAAEQSTRFSDLTSALQKVVALVTGNVADMDKLSNGNLPNGTNPVASGNLKTFLEGNYQTYLKNRFASFKYAHETHSSSYDATSNPTDVYNDTTFEGVYIDEATELGTCYIIKNINNVPTGFLFCASIPTNTSLSKTQIALYYNGNFKYRYKHSNNGAWDDWASIELQKNKDSYSLNDGTYYGISNDDNKYPSSKAVYQFIKDNYEKIINSVIFGYDTLNIDYAYDIHKTEVNTYLNNSDYSEDTDYTISALDGFSFGYETHGRPNKVAVSIPSGGTTIVFKDTVSGRQWKEAVASTTYIQNLIPNRVYVYHILDASGTILKTGTAKGNGKVRMINAGGDTYNIRDIGGWDANGGTLKYGMIYRGGELNSGITITEAQQNFFKDALGIRDEIDLRGTGYDSTALGIGVDYISIPLPYVTSFGTFNSSHYEKSRDVIKRVAKDISENKPIYIHCQAGADRTGMTCLFIEAICGVSQNDIDRDYELTSFSKEPGTNNNWSNRITRKRNLTSSIQLKSIVTAINAMEGSNFNDKVIRFLLRAGVAIDELNTIRFGLVDGNPTKIVNPYSNATITKTFSNASIDNEVSSIALYQPYEATLTATGTRIFDSITITMNGSNNTNYSLANLKTVCKIKIPSVTGNIVISATTKPATYIESVNSGNIVAGAVSTSHIANGAVTELKIADGAVTENKLSFIASKYVIATTLPSVSNANVDTDYYIGTASNGYTHYRFINGSFIPLGNDSYSKSEVDDLLASKENYMSWADIQKAVRRGHAEKLFPVGYEFEVKKSGGGTIPFVVLGHNTISPQDSDLTHSMILGTKYIFGDENSAYTPIQFDAPEALIYATNLIGGQTYVFNWAGSNNMASGNWYCYVPNDMNGAYQAVLNEGEKTLSFYLILNNTPSPTATQTLSISQSSSGGNVTGFTTINDANRVLYGSNNYAQSAVRQFLNSSSSGGNVWTPKTVFDRPPSWADTLSGFMSNINDSDFMQVIVEASVPCRTNDLFETDSIDGTHFTTSSTYTVNDKFFLLSCPEISGKWDNANIKDGEQLDYYNGSTQLDRIKYDKNGTARYCFLRSPRTANNVATTQYIYCLNPTDGVSVSSARNTYGIAPVCIIA